MYALLLIVNLFIKTATLIFQSVQDGRFASLFVQLSSRARGSVDLCSEGGVTRRSSVGTDQYAEAPGTGESQEGGCPC